MRYRGQAYNLTVPFAGRPTTAAAIAAAEAAFEDQHRRLYDYTPTVTETEIVTLRLRAVARIAAIDWADDEPARTAADGGRRRVWSGGSWGQWRMFHRDSLAAGDAIGPETVVEQEDATVVVPAGWYGRVGAAGTIVLEREMDA
jgi:N-methylhydantoinase A